MPNRRHLLPAAAALGLATRAAAQPACADPAAAALVGRYVALKNAADASRCAELYLEDYQERSGRGPSGLAALVANWQAQFETMPDLRLTLEDLVSGGDRVVARITYAATHTRPLLGVAPTGRRFSFATIDIWRIAGGRFAEHWDVVDFAGLARQLGGR